MTQLPDAILQQAYRYATALANDRDVAMDLVHTSYLKYCDRPALPAHDPQRYFMRVVRNTFLDRKRHEARWQMDDLEQLERVVDIDTHGLETLTIQRDMLQQLWSQLNALEREVLYLWAVEEYTVDEIAQRTDTPRGTLLARLHRLKKKLVDPSLPVQTPTRGAHR